VGVYRDARARRSILYPGDPDAERKTFEEEEVSYFVNRCGFWSRAPSAPAPAVGRPTARSRLRRRLRRRRQASGLSRSDRNPRKQFFPHGDWDTRIPGTNPLLPAVNSKARALPSSQETTSP